jgi:uncharacterized membrane protein
MTRATRDGRRGRGAGASGWIASHLMATPQERSASRPWPHPGGKGAAAIERVAPFSDGVFAIAITLLIIEIGVPAGDVSGHELNAALKDLLPQFFSFVFSFLVIGRYWIAHHLMLDHVKHREPGLLWLNLLFLLCIAFLPFPTALLGEHLDEATAAVVYAGTMCATGIASSILWLHVSRTNQVDPQVARHVLLRAATIPVIFGLSIPAAYVHLDMGLASMTLATVLWLVALPMSIVVPLVARRRASMRVAPSA